MHHIAGLLLCMTVASADTGSNGYVYGGGNVEVGQIQLDSHSQSQYNGLPSTIGQSMNSGSGTGVSINGQANSGVNVSYVNDNIPNQMITGNSNANSNGNAATGQLNNNDNSNSANSNGLSVDGHSQIWANGTGVSVNNNANSNVIKYPITTSTTTACSVMVSCQGNCFPSNCYYCACPTYEAGVAVPEAAKPKSQLISKGNQRKSLQNARSRGQNAGKNAVARSQQRSSLKNKAQSNGLENARKRTYKAAARDFKRR